MGHWPGLGEWTDEGIILLGALASLIIMITGSLGLTRFYRSEQCRWSIMIIVFYLAAIAMLAGLSRYRIPIEPLLMLYGSEFLFGSRVAASRHHRGTMITIAFIVTFFALWFLPSGWSTWRSWF